MTRSRLKKPIWRFGCLTRLLGQLDGLPLLEGGHLIEAQVFLRVVEAVEVDALAVDHHVRQLLGQFQLLFLLQDKKKKKSDETGRDESHPPTPAEDSPHLFLLLVLVFVSRLLLLGHVRVCGCSLLSEDGLQFVQSLPFDEELTLQLLKKKNTKPVSDPTSPPPPQKNRRAQKNLWRWEICGHGVPQGGGDESAAQDGAHVVGHDLLLCHAAVVLQREDDRVVRSLMVEEREKS